jgi:hypothetical protein
MNKTVTESEHPDIEVALDVRSYERVVVLSRVENNYPERWEKTFSSRAEIDNDTVIIIDRTDISQDDLGIIASAKPRMVAFVPFSVEQEKSMRRMISTLYPWAQVWMQFTTFGKILYTSEIYGLPYNREELVDMSNAEAV